MLYDDADRLRERVLPNGVKTTYTYDELDQVESIVHQNSTGTVLASVNYERNPGGEPNQITREDGSYVVLKYDAALRLKEETYYDATGDLEEQISYTYDADGKRTTKRTGSETLTYNYEPGYQLVSVTGGSEAESYRFDVDGRVEKITRDGSTLILDHDTYDRLIQAGSTDYLYDGMKRRVKSTGFVKRNFLVAPAMGAGLESIYQVVNGSGAAVAEYVYAGMDPLLKQDPGGMVYYLTDAMGSVVGLVDESGQKLADFHYDGFGNLRKGGELGGDFQFHGQWLEKETGLYHLRSRDYDPATGRFLSRDPVDPALGEPESLDPFQFAFNSPLVYKDITGEFSITSLNAKKVIEANLRTYARNSQSSFTQRLLNESQQILLSGAEKSD